MADEVHKVPVHFGDRNRPLFGWLYGRNCGAIDVGVVVCAPFGHEATNCHQTLRAICAGLSSAGFPSLRFDYPSTGNSADDGQQPGIPTWIRSIRLAIEKLRADRGVKRIILVGIRFGATLAALAAEDRGDVAGLIGISPVVNGQSGVREWRTTEAVREWRRTEHSSRGRASPMQAGAAVEMHSSRARGLEIWGLTLADPEVKSIASIDLCEMGCAVSDVLIIDQESAGEGSDWAIALRAIGARVERSIDSTLTEMMRDPAYASVPGSLVGQLVSWCLRLPDIDLQPADKPLHAPARATEMRVVADAVFESLHVREDDGEQFGVLTETHTNAPDRPTLLLVNSGAVHHIGPGRLYVELARHFAALGFLVLRLDLSGLGDSDAHAMERSNSPYTARGVGDISGWLAYLRTVRSVGDCYLLGVCSGGFHAFRAAMDDLPFAKVFSLNPVNFHWKEGMALDVPFHNLHDYDVKHQVISIAAGYRRSLGDLRKWRRLASGKVNLRLASQIAFWRTSANLRSCARRLVRFLGVRVDGSLEADLEAYFGKRTGLELIYSRGDPGIRILYEQAGPVVANLQRQKKLVVLEVAGADHTFSTPSARAALKVLIAERLRA